MRLRFDHRGPLRRALDYVFYALGYAFFWTAFSLIWRRRIVGKNNIPRRGGAIFASNHLSLADPPLVGTCLPRQIHFMAKKELFEIPLVGWYIKHVNAFSISRADRDVAAFRHAQRLLEAGEALIVFLEGTRQRSGELGRAKPGVGMLASKAGCPVVPVHIQNSHKMKSLCKITVSFGPPMTAAPGEDYQDFSNRVMDQIRKLKENLVGS
jgi:1-acyl-sn-glycerol-3-phosphate acyltransferase